jgi:hypothetical protein
VRAAEPTPDAPKQAQWGIARYLPLEHDTVSSFVTETESGDQGVLMLEIRRPREGLAELQIAGRVQRLYLTEAAVEHATGGFVLRLPLQTGARFRGAFGEVTVTQVGVSLKTPAGEFADCIETVEERATPRKRAVSRYCAGVGLASLFIEGNTEDGYASERYSLKSHGRRVQLFE